MEAREPLSFEQQLALQSIEVTLLAPRPLSFTLTQQQIERAFSPDAKERDDV